MLKPWMLLISSTGCVLFVDGVFIRFYIRFLLSLNFMFFILVSVTIFVLLFLDFICMQVAFEQLVVDKHI